MSSNALIALDGSFGEGSGALLRTALVMSAMTQQAVRLEHVRGGSKFPGIDVEDVVLVNALARMCQADVVGSELGSSTLTFLPKSRPSGLNASLDAVRTVNGRGPNALIVLNSLLPVLARAGVYSTVAAEGETFGFHSLSYDYFFGVTVDVLKRLGLHCFPDLLRPGFGRDSEGEVRLEVEPSSLHGIEWTERGSLRSVRAVVSTAAIPKNAADRAVSHLKNLSRSAGLSMEVEHVECGGKQAGMAVTAFAQYERGAGGGSSMGARGVRAETVAQNAFEQLLGWMSSNATIDEHLADQLLMPLVFAEGPSSFTVPRLSQRLMTAIWVVKQFKPIHLTVRGNEGSPGTVSIQR